MKEAEAAHAEALAIEKQLADAFPNRPEFRQELADGHNSLGGLLANTGRPKEAEAAYVEALNVRKQLAAQFPKAPGYHERRRRRAVHPREGGSPAPGLRRRPQLLDEAIPYHQAGSGPSRSIPTTACFIGTAWWS